MISCMFIVGSRYRGCVLCNGFLRHKHHQVTPEWLLARGVQVYRIVQRPGQYVIIKPGVIH